MESVDTESGAHESGYRMEGDIPCVGFAVGGKHVHAAAIGQCRRLADDAALANTRRPNDTNYAADPVNRLIEETGNGVELPGAPDQPRVAPPAVIAGLGDQAVRWPRTSSPFDFPLSRFSQHAPPPAQPRR